MRKLALFALLALTACGRQGATPPPATISAAPVAPKVKIVEVEVQTPAPPASKPDKVVIPPLPEELQRSPKRLPDLVDGTLKGVMRDGAATDSMYNDLSARYRALVKLYNCVRGSVNDGEGKIDGCLNK